MKTLDAIACTAFPIAVIALPFLIWNWLRFIILRRRAEPSARGTIPFPTKSVLFFVIALAITMAAAQTSEEIAHNQILDELDALKGDYGVSINGRVAENPTQVVAMLKKLDWLHAHHSSPTRRITVQISDDPDIVLQLARDSSNPKEYWVFYPKYFITRSNEIGRIITPLFDAY